MPPIKNTVVRDWPDLTLVHPERGFLFVEVKAAKGTPTLGQLQVLLELSQAGIEAHTWRPADAAEALARLDNKGALQSARRVP